MMSARCMKPMSFVSNPGEYVCTCTAGRHRPSAFETIAVPPPSRERRAKRVDVKARRVGALVVALRRFLRLGDRLLAAANIRAVCGSFEDPRAVLAESHVAVDAAGQRRTSQVVELGR